MREREIFKINKHDLKNNVVLGVSLPFSNSSVFNPTYTTKDQIKSNLINILLTNKGERFMNPNFGCDLRKIIFDPIQDEEGVKNLIYENLLLFIPEIEIKKLDIINNEDYNSINIVLNYSIRNTKMEDNINILFK